MILLIILCICLGIGCIVLYSKAQKSVVINERVQKENNDLEQLNAQLQVDHEALKIKTNTLVAELQGLEGKSSSLQRSIKTEQEILSTLKATNQQMQADASDQAEQFYKDKIDQLNKELEQKRIRTNQEIEEKQNQLRQQLDKEREQAVAARLEELNKLEQQVEQEQDKLDNLKAKQLAFIEAQQRAEELEAQKDYYRMIISDEYLDDIRLLRQIQVQLHKRDAVDKVIYETYYRQAYDLLMSHLFSSTAKICGIYKITNLENGQAYIGQSVDMRERMRQHIKTSLSSAPSTNKLYQQMKKYGPENFTFEILETVERAKLNERESYWIDFYKTKEFGMNGTKGNS